MRFAQFYTLSTGYIEGTVPPQYGDRKPIEACGDRAVLVLDARRNLENEVAEVAEVCKKRGFIGFSIHEGRNILDSKEVRKLQLI